MTTHDTYSPSRLAMLEQCLDWEGSQDSDDAAFGTYIHDMIRNHGEGAPIDGKPWDVFMAKRAIAFLKSLGDYEWRHEYPISGLAIPNTGGTIDAFTIRKDDRMLHIVDWKGSLPDPSSAQGKAYALNLWTFFNDHVPYDEIGFQIEGVVVTFYNYMDGSTCHAEYRSLGTLRSDIGALIRRHGGQMGKRRSACKACTWCKHKATCEEAMNTTTAELSVPVDTSIMPLDDLLAFHTKLKAVMKRAEALESAARQRLMDAARAGELPGYTVKSKRGNKLEWSNEEAASDYVANLLDNNFVANVKVAGLLAPSKVKDELRKALGVSYTDEVDAQLSSFITQNTYEILAKEAKHEAVH